MTKLNRHAAAVAPALPVTALGLTGYFFIGTAAVLIPSVMPFITSEYMATGLTLAAIGLIFPARAVGGILGNLLAGVGSDRLGYSKLVWMAALALSVSMALAAAAHPWLLFIAGFALISIVQASLSTGINAMVADANRASRARALNVLHGVYAVGATISPLVIGLILEQRRALALDNGRHRSDLARLRRRRVPVLPRRLPVAASSFRTRRRGRGGRTRAGL